MHPPTALTVTSSGGLANVIVCEVGVCLPFTGEPSQPDIGLKRYQSLWDTGATASVITEKVVSELDLKPISMTMVHTANGTSPQNQYLVNIALPNGVMIQNLKVTEAKITGPDLLIGMDIINLGDFSITNHQGKTVMSFRMPSCHVIDYVKLIETEKMPRHERRRLAREALKHK